MSNPSLKPPVEEPARKAAKSAKARSGPEAPATSTSEPISGDSGLPAASPSSIPKPRRGGSSLAVALVVLLAGTVGLGIFGLVQFQSASSLRSQVSVLHGELSGLHSEVSGLTTTVAGLQIQNDHYQGVLTRVRAATGSLQASLAELNQLAALPAPSGAAPATAFQSMPASETAN